MDGFFFIKAVSMAALAGSVLAGAARPAQAQSAASAFQPGKPALRIHCDSAVATECFALLARQERGEGEARRPAAAHHAAGDAAHRRGAKTRGISRTR